MDAASIGIRDVLESRSLESFHDGEIVPGTFIFSREDIMQLSSFCGVTIR